MNTEIQFKPNTINNIIIENNINEQQIKPIAVENNKISFNSINFSILLYLTFMIIVIFAVFYFYPLASKEITELQAIKSRQTIEIKFKDINHEK